MEDTPLTFQFSTRRRDAAFFLNEGLYFEDEVLKGLGGYTPHGYTEALDRYYDFLGGRVSSGEKPRSKRPEEYKELIRKIEATEKEGLTEVTTLLLGFDTKSMLDVLANIQKAKRLAETDGRDHDATMLFSSSNLGLTLSVSIDRNAESLKNLGRYCALKMYQNKLEKWLMLLIDYNDGRESIDFRVYNQKWNHSATMEGQLERYRQIKLKEFIATGKRLGRNDYCPCNSGIKYKKCCGK